MIIWIIFAIFGGILIISYLLMTVCKGVIIRNSKSVDVKIVDCNAVRKIDSQGYWKESSYDYIVKFNFQGEDKTKNISREKYDYRTYEVVSCYYHISKDKLYWQDDPKFKRSKIEGLLLFAGLVLLLFALIGRFSQDFSLPELLAAMLFTGSGLIMINSSLKFKKGEDIEVIEGIVVEIIKEYSTSGRRRTYYYPVYEYKEDIYVKRVKSSIGSKSLQEKGGRQSEINQR